MMLHCKIKTFSDSTSKKNLRKGKEGRGFKRSFLGYLWVCVKKVNKPVNLSSCPHGISRDGGIRTKLKD